MPALEIYHSAFEPGAVWLDLDGIPINAHGGGILLHAGIFYWYGEFKIGGPAGNSAQEGVSCYASTDLYSWRNCGIVLPVDKTDPLAALAQGCIIERPKVLYNEATGKFVMWFHHERKGWDYHWAHIGVGVSEQPTGPFRFVKSFRGDRQMSRDMTLFQDDDGRAYQVRAAEDNWTLHLQQLSTDFLSFEGDFTRLFPGALMEAPTLIKQAGRYHMINSGCTGWAPNPARYATATHLRGPWTEHGNPCQGPEAETTYRSQGTFLLRSNQPDRLIFMADRWSPANPIDGRYVWLPVEVDDEGSFKLRWQDKWSL